jgi:hypothetical protein
MSNPTLVFAIRFLWNINNNYREDRRGIITQRELHIDVRDSILLNYVRASHGSS